MARGVMRAAAADRATLDLTDSRGTLHIYTQMPLALHAAQCSMHHYLCALQRDVIIFVSISFWIKYTLTVQRSAQLLNIHGREWVLHPKSVCRSHIATIIFVIDRLANVDLCYIIIYKPLLLQKKKSTKEYRQRLGEPAEMDPVDWNWGTAMEMYIDLYVWRNTILSSLTAAQTYDVHKCTAMAVCGVIHTDRGILKQ